MFYIAVCAQADDCENLSVMIREIIGSFGFNCQIRVFYNHEELLDDTEYTCPFHIVFMDIDQDHYGIKTAAALRQRNYKNFIVFFSDTAKYALDSYQVKAYDYLLKPVSRTALQNTLETICQELLDKNAAIIPIHTKSGMYMIRQRDILYLESQNHNLILHCKNAAPLTFNGKLDNIRQKLPPLSAPAFLRCHKSYVVNREYVQKVEPTCLQLTDGTQVPISRSYKSEVIMQVRSC